MDDPLIRFVEMASDPYWLLFVMFVAGFGLGWAVSSLHTLADYLMQYLLPILRKKGKDSDA